MAVKMETERLSVYIPFSISISLYIHGNFSSLSGVSIESSAYKNDKSFVNTSITNHTSFWPLSVDRHTKYSLHSLTLFPYTLSLRCILLISLVSRCSVRCLHKIYKSILIYKFECLFVCFFVADKLGSLRVYSTSVIYSASA